MGEDALLNIRPKENFESPSRKNYDHFCIVMDFDVEERKDDLEKKGYNILREGVPLGTEGRAPAIYVEDPFGYVIEIKETDQ